MMLAAAVLWLIMPLSVWIGTASYAVSGQEVSPRVKVGMMYGRPNSLEEKVFRLAMEHYAEEQRSLSTSFYSRPPVNITTIESVIDLNDMFELSKQLCFLAREGVAAIFSGSAAFPIPAVIQSYASAFNISHLTFQTGISELNHAVELQPRFEEAISTYIQNQQWTSITVVFDDFNTMQRVTSLIGTQVVSTKYVYDDHSIDSALTETKKSASESVLLFLAKNNTEALFRKAAEKEMLTQKYKYLIADLRMPCRKVHFDISGKINITCFKLVEDSSDENREFVRQWKLHYPDDADSTEENQLEVALAYDSFKVLTTILASPNLVYRDDSARKHPSKMCLSDKVTVAAHGTNIADLLLELQMDGLTGNIQFNELGLRRNYTLQIMDVGFNQTHSRIANWSDIQEEGSRGLKFETDRGGLPKTKASSIPGRMRITAVLSPPFLQRKAEFENEELYPDEKLNETHFEGFLVDLMNMIMEPYRDDINYSIRLVKDGAYGGLQAEDGTWNGMIGELLRGEADVALAPLTINSARQQVVDFTKPYMTLGIAIMMREPTKPSPGYFSFLDPLKNEIWMCCLLAYMSVSVVLFLVSRFSSNEWADSPSEDGEKENQFGIINCLWFSLGSFMQQGGDICPNSLPGRVVASSWWFFTLIIISSYTANLAAFLTADRMKTPIKGAEDLAAQTAIEYGVLQASSSKAFFEKSQVGTYQRMFSFMEDRGLFEQTTQEGVRKVREQKNYAFLMESIMMEWYNQQLPCNTYKVGNELNTISYGLATPKDSVFLSNLTLQVLELAGNNEISALEKVWWVDKTPCPKEKTIGASGIDGNKLQMDRVNGVFLLISIAVVTGVVVALTDIVLLSVKQAHRWKIPVADTLKANIRMAMWSKYQPPPAAGPVACPESPPERNGKHSCTMHMTPSVTQTTVFSAAAPIYPVKMQSPHPPPHPDCLPPPGYSSIHTDV